ncbi:MAG TPA: hypothetical protein VK742_17390, partial [Candidatus Sulfotelmatobacter sp.]|nr:hypothetical protein [Candidatus Sulfotelmatobacter sp.]
HYGDMYAPYIKQEEPLKTECQHFVDCIKFGGTPISCGTRGTELVRILEASSESLKKEGAPIRLSQPVNDNAPAASCTARSLPKGTWKTITHPILPFSNGNGIPGIVGQFQPETVAI